MKNKIILAGVFALLLSSCGENFLEVPSQTALTDGIYFKTQKDFETAINAAYAPLRGLYTGTSATSEGANAAYIMGEMHSDNARYIINTTFRATTNQENVADFIQEASNSISTFKYRQNYVIIARANKILSSIDAATFDSEAKKNNVKGQALFLRAFAYFDLVQYFNSVPFHLDPVTTLDGTAKPLADRATLINQIITDTQAAIPLLPGKVTQEAGRVTNGAARMLLANVYMVEKNFAAAETALKQIVDAGEYRLMANYSDIFEPVNKNNAESIFEIQYRQGTDGYSSTFIYGMLPYPMAKDTLAKLTGVTDATALAGGEAFNVPSPDLLDAYEPGDLRLKTSVGYTYDVYGERFPFCKKYLHPHLKMNQSDDNWPVYRYAEVLLFLAEAINEQGRSAEALNYINNVVGSNTVSIRQRAGLAAISATSQDEVREAIAKERRIELAFENKRWLDLVRTGKAEEVITAYGAKIKADPAKYYFPEGYQPLAKAFSKIDLVWPLPADEAMYSPYF